MDNERRPMNGERVNVQDLYDRTSAHENAISLFLFLIAVEADPVRRGTPSRYIIHTHRRFYAMHAPAMTLQSPIPAGRMGRVEPSSN